MSTLFDSVSTNQTDDGYGWIQSIRAINPDFIPIVYYYYGFVALSWENYPVWSPQRRQYEFMKDYPLFMANGDSAIVDWGALRTNPTVWDTTGAEPLSEKYWERNAVTMAELLHRSSAYVDKMGFMADWFRSPDYPNFEGVVRDDVDLDGDGVAYDVDPCHDHFTRLLGECVTEEEAWVASCDSAVAAFNRHLQDELLIVNGHYADYWKADEAEVSGTNGHLWEFWREDTAAGYSKTWRDFRSTVESMPSVWDNGLAFEPSMWDSRGTSFNGGSGAFTEGVALISNSVAGWSAFDDTTAAYRIRMAYALDDTAASMDLGPPTGDAVFDSLFHAYRIYGDYRVDLRWGGDRRYPAGAGWKITYTPNGTVIREHAYDTMPTYMNATMFFGGYEENNSAIRPGMSVHDYDLPLLDYNVSASVRRGTAADTDYTTNSNILLRSITTWDTRTDDAYYGMLYFGLDKIAGATVDTASLGLQVSWARNLAAGDTLYVVAACGDGFAGWHNDATTWNNKSPGVAWPVDMDDLTLDALMGTHGAYEAFTISDFPSGNIDNEELLWPITDLVQVAADYPNEWAGLWLLYRSNTAARQQSFDSAVAGLAIQPFVLVTTTDGS